MSQKELIKKALFTILLVSLDQFSKCFTLKKICNPGISWGINLNQNILWLVVIFSLIFLIYYTYKSRLPYSLLFILSGAFGNLLDRLQHRCVVDFISLGKFPTFNLADIFITVGFLVFFWQKFIKQNTNHSAINKKIKKIRQ